MSRRTEDDDARDLLASLNNKGFRICEQVPIEHPNYLEGAGATEFRPIEDKRAVRLLAMLLLSTGDKS